MSKQKQTGRRPAENILMYRGYLVITDIDIHNDGADYTFLADNGGQTQLVQEAEWCDTPTEAIEAIYKHNIKPVRVAGGVYCPRVVYANVQLNIERVAFECSLNDAEGVDNER